MKLRIARKMDRGWWKRRRIDERDKRPWHSVYTDDQLQRAVVRLRKSWRARCPLHADADGKLVRGLTPDFNAAYRVESRLIRQRVLRKAQLRQKVAPSKCR